MLNPFRAAVLACIVATIAGITAYLYVQTAHYEASVAESSFRGRFASYGVTMQDYTRGLLRGLRGVADSVNSHGSLPSTEAYAKASARGGASEIQ